MYKVKKEEKKNKAIHSTQGFISRKAEKHILWWFSSFLLSFVASIQTYCINKICYKNEWNLRNELMNLSILINMDRPVVWLKRTLIHKTNFGFVH